MRNLFMLMTLLMFLCITCNKPEDKAPIRVVTELNVGESRDVVLSNGESVNLTLLGISDVRDSLRNAIRDVKVHVSIDGDQYTLGSGNYNLPFRAGRVQIDCPGVKNYYDNSNSDHWGLNGDARFRLWPEGSTYMTPGTFVYPIRQVWFASMTQSGNEPTYVDWGEDPEGKSIYYHSGHDMGGAEGMDEILSATDGLVISSAGDTLDGFTDFPGDIRPDVVWILSDWGWYIRYSHLDRIDPEIRTGNRISINQRIGLIGKQGGSGGWVHLHFEIMNRETASGNWGTEEAYAYVWEAYVNQYHPDIIAVARPHQLVWTGQPALLDGSKSRSLNGQIVNYEWTFSDGSSAKGAIQERSYQDPGEYSEILKVTDSQGHVDYDFTVVQVYDPDVHGQTIPTIQPAFHPTLDIHPGDPITFLVRTFNTATGSETWDFGDGSPTVSVVSETVDRRNYTAGKFAETIHSFEEPGDYIVTVERSDEAGIKATAHLHVVVNDIK